MLSGRLLLRVIFPAILESGVPEKRCLVYVEIFRGTPMIVQGMIVYYGLLKAEVNITPVLAGIIVTVLNTGAYMAETVRGGINSVDKGQKEGAWSLGMSPMKTMLLVVLPQAFKNVVPEMVNTFLTNLKMTSVLNVIGVSELFLVAKTAYINTHLTELSMVNPVMAAAYRAAGAYIERMQRQMVQAIREKGFVCFDAFSEFAQTARQSFSSRCSVGDGWLIGGEICNFAKHGYHRIACVQPFGCMANQVCGKGIYSSLQRKLPHVQLVSLDYDASGSDIQVQNRAAMLLF